MDSNVAKVEDLKETIQKYLKKWIDEEEEPRSQLSLQFQRALRSITSVQCKITILENCQTLFGFDSFLINCLKNAIEESSSGSLEADPFEYRPKVKSGAYAILLTLCDKKTLTKHEIETKAKYLCKYSFTVAKPGTSFTAWSAMKILLDRKLVRRLLMPIRYTLTAAGKALAQSLTSSKNQHVRSAVDPVSNEPRRECEKQNEPEQEGEFSDRSSVVSASAATAATAAIIDNDQSRVLHEINVAVDFSKCEALHVDFDPHEPAVSALTAAKDLEKFSSIYKDFLKADFKLLNNNFYLILIVNKNTVTNLELLIEEFSKYKIEFEIRNLKLGTFTWIVREKCSDRELLLPYVIEKISQSHFTMGIKITNEIQFKYSGFLNVFILIECFFTCSVGVAFEQFYKALTKHLMFTNFQYAVSRTFSETIETVAQITNYIEKKFQDKQLFSASFETWQAYLDNNELLHLISYLVFQRQCNQNPPNTAQGLFTYSLTSLSGISIDKAIAITKHYPTIRHLIEKYKTMDTKSAESLLASIRYKGLMKIGPAISRRIHCLITDPYVI